MSRKRKARSQQDHTFMAFSIAALSGLTVIALAEDIRYFAEGSPESFLQTFRVQPISMFVGSLAFVTILYLLQRLNDREHALDYVYPYVLLVAVSAFDLALRFNSVGWSSLSQPVSCGAPCR
jgi:hypothetical protein